MKVVYILKKITWAPIFEEKTKQQNTFGKIEKVSVISVLKENEKSACFWDF